MAEITALQLASEIVRRLSARGQIAPTNLTLQKLAYFCHGWHLALLGTPLVDEEFEAWRFGPVLPSVYHKFKVFSSNPIPLEHPLVQWERAANLTSDSSDVIDRVLDVYGQSSGFQLVQMSHDRNGPWAKVWENSFGTETIDNASIKAYFEDLARQPANT